MLVSLTEAAAANGMAPTTLRGYCQEGRVVGAVRIGNRWAIPAGKVAILPTARQAARATLAAPSRAAPAPRPSPP